MNRMVLGLTAAALACFTVAQAETMPLPDNLIGLRSPEGQSPLMGSEASDDYFPLNNHVKTQVKPA